MFGKHCWAGVLVEEHTRMVFNRRLGRHMQGMERYTLCAGGQELVLA